MSDSKMNPEIKTKWLEALRSGEYEQGKGNLRIPSTNQFCCLGVLSDLYAKETGKAEWFEQKEFGTSARHYRFRETTTLHAPNGSVIGLINPVREWSGVHVGDSSILATMNDDGMTFAEIADHIEKVL